MEGHDLSLGKRKFNIVNQSMKRRMVLKFNELFSENRDRYGPLTAVTILCKFSLSKKRC